MNDLKKPILSFLLFLICTLAWSLSIHASSLSFTVNSVAEQGTLLGGAQYQRILGETLTDAGTLGNQQVSVITSRANKQVEVVSWAKLGTNGIIGASVIDIAKDYESKNPGYTVIASINGDYYDPITKTPINAFVMNDKVIKSSNFNLSRYFSIGFDGRNVIANKNNSVENLFALRVIDPSTNRIIQEFPLQGLNQIPSSGNTTVYFKSISNISISTASIYQVALQHGIQYGSTYLFGHTIDAVNQVTTASNVFFVATTHPLLQELLTGDVHLEVFRPMASVYAGVSQIMGVGSAPLEAGLIKTFEEINDQSVAFAQARHPRSGFGWNEAGDFFFIAIDGRQTNMAGVNLREFAKIFESFGATTAYNLDGGGSTQLAIQEEGVWRMLNSPSDNPYRFVANALLFVVPDVSITMNVDVLSKTKVQVDLDVDAIRGQIQSIEVYIQNQSQTYQNEGLFFEDISDSVIHMSVLVTYEVEGETITRQFAQKRVLLGNAPDDEIIPKAKPSDFQLSIENDAAIQGFRIFITFNDPDKTLTKLYIVHQEQRIIALKAIGGYVAEFEAATPNTTYTLQVEYYYRINTITPLSELDAQVFSYGYLLTDDEIIDPIDPIDPGDPDDTEDPILDPTPEEPALRPISIIIAILSSGTLAIGTLLFFIIKKGRTK